MTGNEGTMRCIAEEIVSLSRDDIVFHLRFMASAIYRLPCRPAQTPTLATNGSEIGYHPAHILALYKAGSACVTRALLHSVLHCLFRHPHVDTLVDHARWDLACDVSAEHIINELGVASLQGPATPAQEEYVATLQPEIGAITAEKVYRYLLDAGLPDAKLHHLAQLFAQDDHETWYQSRQQNASADGGGASSGAGSLDPPDGQPQTEWNDVCRQMKIELETFAKQHGMMAGALTQNLQALTRERYDYSSFLRRFAVLGETMRINDDEFDYIYYTYGLKLYDKMPLVEPLEYKEVKRIRDFVIAIDTSGSVSGDIVQIFLQKTYNILKSAESFFTKFNVHIIQCDAEIQECIKITSQEEFDEYIRTMRLKGFGGTDFRPVFSYIDKLRHSGELPHLKGMVYFTDGFGTFPEKKPDYDAAFVFVSKGYEEPPVPAWAIRLVLDTEDIKKI